MADYEGTDFRGKHFDWVEFGGARLTSCSLSDTYIDNTDLHRVTMKGVELLDVTIEGDVERVFVNGVDIAPLVEAELDRREPLRAKMRPDDPDGYREAWDVLDGLWQGTVQRARALPPEALHESVDGEWSFVETLRHLAFASDSWVGRAILGDPSPWHPLDLPWDQMPDTPGVPRDREARPSLDEALKVRERSRQLVARYLADLTPEQLAADTTPVEGPGWPEARSYPVAQCLRIVLNEEWCHRQYAERDLAVLEQRRAGAGSG